ncbi:hypothetical protein Agub_g15609 [Astrephomene gubernaculifera]|uniref:Protein kinase domain-containing protein n=1 Tax=Astrephomene gubernaculifera TaxID=47775 RepID=A0AAD3E593_9CHLO|nr:hypothetical protein Agub_g15609 [Astrephomene gubernaculifera]
MGFMKKAVAALGFGDGNKSKKHVSRNGGPDIGTGSLSSPQRDLELPADLHVAISSNALCSSQSIAPTPFSQRSSVDGRLTAALLSAPLRGMCGTLDSPGVSAACTPTGSFITGGGHGEAPPTNTGGLNSHPIQRTGSPLGRHLSCTMQLPSPVNTATATPLARHVANRALRKAGDSGPLTLPSISTTVTGGSKTPAQQQQPPQEPHQAGAAGPSPAPEPSLGLSHSQPPPPPNHVPQSMLLSHAISHHAPMQPPPAQLQLQTSTQSPPAESSLLSPSSPAPPTSPSPRPPMLMPVRSPREASPRMRRATTLDQQPAGSAEIAGSPFGTSVATAAAAAASITTAISAPSALGDLRRDRERFSRFQSLPLSPIPQTSNSQLPQESIPEDSAAAAAAAAPQQQPLPEYVKERQSPTQGNLPMFAARVMGEPQLQPNTPQAAQPSAAAAAAMPPSPPLQQQHGSAAGLKPTPPPLLTAPHPYGSLQHQGLQQLQQQLQHQQLQQQMHQQHQQLMGIAAQRRRLSDLTVLPPSAAPETPVRKLKVAATAAAAVAAEATSSSRVSDADGTATEGAAGSAVPESRLRALAKPEPLRMSIGASSQTGPNPTTWTIPNPSPNPSPGGSPGMAAGGPSPAAAPGRMSSLAPAAPPSARRSSSVCVPASSAAAAAAAHHDVTEALQQHQLQQQQQQQQHRQQVTTTSSRSPPGHQPAAAESSTPAPTAVAIVAMSPRVPTSSSITTPAIAAAAVPGLYQPGAFVARTVPQEGLLHLSAAAPARMRRPASAWGAADFKIVRKLYAGYASSVYKASCLLSGADVVLKAYNLASLSGFLRNQVLRELDIHSRLAHPGAVQLLAAFKEGEVLVLVQEYVRGGSLDRVRRKLGGRMTEFQAMHLVLLPLLGVLAYLHGKGIVHRDIKPENLLFTEDWQLKVCDYGVSICLHEERAVTRTGSREYMAPEVNICPLKRGPEDNKDNAALSYGCSVDVWSLGALVYELLVGFTPFPGGPPPRKEGATGSAAKSLAYPGGVSAGARAFVQACLELEPADRPTVPQLLMHPWVQNALDCPQEPDSKQQAPAAP